MTRKEGTPDKPCPRLGAVVSISLFLGATLAALPAHADQVVDLAQQLARLRGEVEQLSTELGRKDNDGRDQLRSLSRQKADLKLELQKEQVRLQKVQLTISQKRQVIQAEKEGAELVRPVFQAALEDLRAWVRRSLPFRTGERLAELDKIDDQLKAGLLTPPRALSRLWTFVEDEFRLTRESGLYRQSVRVDGDEVLAEVIRVGMVMLFFKTGDGTTGFAVQEGTAWDYRRLETPEDRRLVLDLFESFKRQIRVGYFELPNALSAAGMN